VPETEIPPEKLEVKVQFNGTAFAPPAINNPPTTIKAATKRFTAIPPRSNKTLNTLNLMAGRVNGFRIVPRRSPPKTKRTLEAPVLNHQPTDQ
jgi:hypothetical protein